MPPHRRARSGPIDELDFKILAILQRDNTTSQREIGSSVNLSTAAVQRRIRRLQRDGIIEANIATVAPHHVGRPLTIVVEVQLDAEREDLLDAAKSRFAAAPEVQQCYYVTGNVDFVLVVTVATMGDYEALTRRLFFSNRNVKKFRTLVVMERVKVGLSIPLDGGGWAGAEGSS